MESDKFQTIKKGLDQKMEINDELESNNISTHQTTKVHLHNEQDHIEGDNKPEKEGFNELNVCKICQKRFCSEEELSNHHKQPALTKNYKCCACEKPHRNSSHLIMHIRIHTGDRPYVCVVCSKEFKRNENLKTHMKTHTGERQYECFDCDRNFIRLQDLSRHLASSIHTNHTPHTCFICNKRFKRKKALNCHRRIHYHYKNKTNSAESGDMPLSFKCDICSTVCLSRQDLKQHQMVHKEESHMKINTSGKSFSCATCKRAFRWPKNIKKRIGEICLFMCAICKVRFIREDALNRHMIIHSLKPFSCDTCKNSLNMEVHDKDKLEREQHYITGDARKLEENGQTISNHNESKVIMKIEPEEPHIVEAKWEQEEHCDIADARKLDPNGQTITGRKENNISMKVEPEELQIIEQERFYPQIVYEI